jgi:prenyltransferase/squalene oxidase-like repeat protein
MRNRLSRRKLLYWTLAAAATRIETSASVLSRQPLVSSTLEGSDIRDSTFAFIEACARDDGGFSPSPDPQYRGNSDTAESDLAAVTYAATLAKPLGWHLKHPERSVEYIQRHQQPGGIFVNFQGSMDPKSNLATLYNTVQGAVGLRALGVKPKFDPLRVMDRFFEKEVFKMLPWYTISFYPLFYATLDAPFPKEHLAALEQHIMRNQARDGYLGDHVAATFHMVHFFRLVGKPTPRADSVVRRVLRDQRADGGWQLKAPDWDVHACFDAVFILRQLGWESKACRAAISRGADWALRCRNADGGFGHYPGWHSDMDAVYFQFGTLIQAQRIPGVNFDLPDARTLSWGHAMKPEDSAKAAL